MKKKNSGKKLDEDVYDEIDQFHMDLNVDHSNEQSGRKAHRPREVLSVAVDKDELSPDEDDYESEATSDDEEMEKTLPGANTWGKNRKSYYGTSYVDEDWGGVNESDEELIELEEEDAIARQKKLDAAIAAVDYETLAQRTDENVQQSAPPAEKCSKKDWKKMSEEERLKQFTSMSPELQQVVEEYNEKKAVMETLMEPLRKMLVGPLKETESLLKRQLSLVYGAYSRYLMNLLLYIQLKITAPGEKLKSVAQHPILDDIIKFKQVISKVDAFVHRNEKRLHKLVLRFTTDESFAEKYALPKTTVKPKQLKKKKKRRIDEVTEMETDEFEGNSGGHRSSKKRLKKDSHKLAPPELLEDGDEKRKITYEMDKNKGLTAKRKKGTEHSRIKKRKQYDKALIRRRSQVPDVRHEIGKYSGEKRGIKASTIRSVKLKA
jgi:U3 small nucleolar RNA-associated protein 3